PTSAFSPCSRAAAVFESAQNRRLQLRYTVRREYLASRPGFDQIGSATDLIGDHTDESVVEGVIDHQAPSFRATAWQYEHIRRMIIGTEPGLILESGETHGNLGRTLRPPAQFVLHLSGAKKNDRELVE